MASAPCSTSARWTGQAVGRTFLAALTRLARRRLLPTLPIQLIWMRTFARTALTLQCLAALWKNGRLTALPTLPGGHNTKAFGLNILGQVVRENGTSDSTCAMAIPYQKLRFEAAIWGPNGEMRELSTLAGGIQVASTPKKRGEIGGFCTTTRGPQPRLPGPQGQGCQGLRRLSGALSV